MTIVDDEKLGIVRKLAHTDKAVRDEAVQGVVRWLERRSNVTSVDLLKLWKALYYCMWMSDKPRVQSDLADNMAGIIRTIPSDRVVPYVTAFLETMLREWHGTDKLRLDKFYTLVRRSMRSIYYVAFRPDFADRSSDLIDTVSRLILANTDAKSRGLTLHVADVLVDELNGALDETGPGEDAYHYEVVWRVLQSSLSVLTTTAVDRVQQKRLHDRVFMRILDDAETIASSNDDDDVTVSNLTTLILMNAADLSNRFFDAAADPASAERNRKALYSLRTRFQTLQQLVERALEESDDENGHGGGDGEPCPSALGLPAGVHSVQNVVEDEHAQDGNAQTGPPDVDPPVQSAELKTPSRRRRRRSSLASTPNEDGRDAKRQTVEMDGDRASECVDASASGDAPVAQPVIAADQAQAEKEEERPATKSVSFSATKSIRKFNKATPIKIKTPARELIAKKSPGSALKTGSRLK